MTPLSILRSSFDEGREAKDSDRREPAALGWVATLPQAAGGRNPGSQTGQPGKGKRRIAGAPPLDWLVRRHVFVETFPLLQWIVERFHALRACEVILRRTIKTPEGEFVTEGSGRRRAPGVEVGLDVCPGLRPGQAGGAKPTRNPLMRPGRCRGLSQTRKFPADARGRGAPLRRLRAGNRRKTRTRRDGRARAATRSCSS